MNGGRDSKIRALLIEFVDYYCELAQVNRRIGIWDMRRHAVCKQEIDEIDKAYLVKTERMGRQAVERRAVVKTRLDEIFARIVDLKPARADRT